MLGRVNSHGICGSPAVVWLAGRYRVFKGGQAAEKVFVLAGADPASDHCSQRLGQGARDPGGHAFDLRELPLQLFRRGAWLGNAGDPVVASGGQVPQVLDR